jgi:hypothetical protein
LVPLMLNAQSVFKINSRELRDRGTKNKYFSC